MEDEAKEDREGEWNRSFQHALNCLRHCPQKKTLSQRTLDNQRLLHLSEDFVSCAATYGRIIISEVAFPAEFKTIKPVPMGGMAGMFCSISLLIYIIYICIICIY